MRGLNVGHTVIRAEQAGDDIVLTGYRDREGLQVTLLDLDRPGERSALAVADGGSD